MKKLTILMGVFTLGLTFSISAQEKVAQDQPEELDEIVIDTRFKIKKKTLERLYTKSHQRSLNKTEEKQ